VGDILNLTWDQVDLKNPLFAIIRTRKTGAPVCLPILDELYAELKAQQKRAKGPYVLPVQHGRIYADGNPAAVSWTMRWLFRRAGIKNRPGEPMATFHSLRHTFVTRLITRGVNPAIVREAVGHSTMLMTERYTHIDAETLQAALKP
jgi:integrase